MSTTPFDATGEAASDRGVVDLSAHGATLLATAREASSGRAARNLMPAAGAALTQTMVALQAGAALSEHTTPGPATIQVLAGRVTLSAGDERVTLGTGEWSTIPRREHRLDADEDAVALLTVAGRGPVSG
jgi:quercetin dioxygenase-like cupin family protein